MKHRLKMLIHFRNITFNYEVNKLLKGDTNVEWVLLISELPILKFSFTICFQNLYLNTLWEAMSSIISKISKKKREGIAHRVHILIDQAL